MAKPIIALDADGVLLDYHASYRSAWHQAFNELPVLKDMNAYWPIDRWDVRKLDGGELAHFRSFFNVQFWQTIPAITGAVDACHRLHDAGFELICVSALEPEFQTARLVNLQSQGFPIERVIATNAANGTSSPKSVSLNGLNPIAFVDDFLPYHKGVSSEIHRALITRETNGSPNSGPELEEIDSSHIDVVEFAEWWLTRLSKSNS